MLRRKCFMAMKMSQAATMQFGAGSLAVLGDQLKMRGLKKAIIITDKGVTGAGVTAKVEAVIKEAGIECALYDECLADAPSDTVTLAANAARDAKSDAIIALGGGSSMDTAKAVSLILKDPKPITEVRGKPPVPPDVPLITSQLHPAPVAR
jgi:alcohol dehydrogenase class IV